MKLAGHAGLSHKLRAKLFMKNINVPEERIAEVMAKLKRRHRKEKTKRVVRTGVGFINEICLALKDSWVSRLF